MQYLLKALNKYSQRFLVFQKMNDWRTRERISNLIFWPSTNGCFMNRINVYEQKKVQQLNGLIKR